MRLHNIMGDTQARTLSAFLRRNKRLQDFVFDLVGNARAVVIDGDLDPALSLTTSNP